MEMLFWRPSVSQKCPLPVHRIGHRVATQQYCDQAAGTIRLMPTEKAQKESVEMEQELPQTDQTPVLPGSAVLMGLYCFPLLPMGITLEPPAKFSEKASQTHSSVQVPLFCLNTGVG